MNNGNEKKVAFINQRYGLEVNGGSEYYTRIVAEHLSDIYDVHVITTKAVDYMTWEDFYTEDYEEINNVKVHRFSVDRPRRMKDFNKINGRILNDPAHTIKDEEEWIDEQGPLSSKLVAYIRDHADEYDVFIFVTYLYYTTSKGLPQVAEKSILIPTAHDEPYIYFKVFEDIFRMPRAIVFLTEEEKMFVQTKFRNKNVLNDTMAVGIDVPTEIDADKFCSDHKVDDYIIYVGRIDEGKNCHVLFRYFDEYKKRNPGNLKLLLMGKSVIDVPKNPDIINLGFVSEEEKYNGISGAKALILPSKFESLSISVLEALSICTPIIVDGECEVLKGHCVKSNAGLYYRNYFEFEGCLNYILNNPEEAKAMGENGKKYVDNNYTWTVIIDKFKTMIETVCS